MSPFFASRYLFDAFADARRDEALSPTSLTFPELPVVFTTSETRAGALSQSIGLRAIAGPSDAKAFARRAINSLSDHAGSTRRTSL